MDIPDSAAGEGPSTAATADDDELSVPRASVNKIIKDLAPNLRVSTDTRELIISCCNEFVQLLASEANDVCEKQVKKTIAPEHVVAALENLGFSSYKSQVSDCMEEAKQVAQKRRRQSTKLENLGIPEEELLRQQQQLFAEAREQQAAIEQQEWQQMQANLIAQQQPQQVNQAAVHPGYGNPGVIMAYNTVPAHSQGQGQPNVMSGGINPLGETANSDDDY